MEYLCFELHPSHVHDYEDTHEEVKEKKNKERNDSKFKHRHGLGIELRIFFPTVMMTEIPPDSDSATLARRMI